MKVERKVIERGGGWFFYIGIKKQWQQLYMQKALNPVFMLVSICIGELCIYTVIKFFSDNFFIDMQISSSFWFFFGLFFF
jgi:hypothetical protein